MSPVVTTKGITGKDTLKRSLLYGSLRIVAIEKYLNSATYREVLQSSAMPIEKECWFRSWVSYERYRDSLNRSVVSRQSLICDIARLVRDMRM